MLQAKGEEKNGTGVIVGRFQVPELTEGHRDLINSVISRHDAVIIVLGLAPVKATKTNPLDYESRRQMIQEVYPDLKVIYIHDHPSNQEWVKNLDKQIELNTPPSSKICLYGSRDSFLDAYQVTGRYQWRVLEPNRIESGSKIREKVALAIKNSSLFRWGAIWAIENQYDKVYPTVDIAVFRNADHGSQYLLASKKEDLGKLRFIGGFVDPNHNDQGQGDYFEQNARREVREEAHIELLALKLIGTFLINDWRYRKGNDKIVTTFFKAEYKSGNPTPDDDIDHLEWVDYKDFNAVDFIETRIVSTHQQLAKALLRG